MVAKEAEATSGKAGVPPWHAMPVAAVLGRLATTRRGLSTAEAGRRLARHGPNRVAGAPRRGALARFLAQFDNVLIYVLLGSAMVTAGLRHWVDTGVIVGVVVVNAVIGFIQEGKAERSLEAIRAMLAPQATVLREGRRMVIAAEALVPGDIVVLRAGDRVPADLRLIEARGLAIDEAPLTGESQAVEKSVAPVAEAAPLAERASMAYGGTLVTHGAAVGVVAATGTATEIGRISAMVAEVRPLSTPLLRQMAGFGRWLTGAILAVAAATFAFGVLVRGFAAGEMFMAAVGLVVAAIPEGLPAIMTIALAIGVMDMARRNAIVRRLPAVETLGSVTVICSDKTGTLTRNELMVQSLVTGFAVYEVTGDGYAPEGTFAVAGEAAAPAACADLLAAARAALLCNDAELACDEGAWTVNGDPTDGALSALAMKAGLDIAFERRVRPRTDLIPFESEHRFMATLHHDHEGHGLIYLKGAPERVLAMCADQEIAGRRAPLDSAYWSAKVEALAAAGQRVLAIAWRPATPEHRILEFRDVAQGLTLIAVFGLIDPPRPEAIAAVARCRAAGIRVKMITGDHPVTAQAIAARFALGGDDRVLTGADLDRLDDAGLSRVAGEVEVFARTAPEHKLRLVRALQGAREVVAMTGDGVNEAPALKCADIGVAMGRKGTEAAKEASEMVLADDNFATIVEAVEQGRTVYDNLRKSILFVLPTSGGEALTIVAAVVLGQALPITPVQILWVNMVTAVTLGLALAFEPTEPGVMVRPPRRPGAPILSPFLMWRVLFVSLLLLGGAFGLYEWQRGLGAGVEAARTVAVNALVAGEAVYLINCRRILARCWSPQAVFGSRPVVTAIVVVAGFQGLLTYWPVMQGLFATAAVDARGWLGIGLFAIALFILVEGEKAVSRRLGAAV